MQTILEMGYAQDIVLSAIEILRQRGKNGIFEMLLLVYAAIERDWYRLVYALAKIR